MSSGHAEILTPAEMLDLLSERTRHTVPVRTPWLSDEEIENEMRLEQQAESRKDTWMGGTA